MNIVQYLIMSCLISVIATALWHVEQEELDTPYEVLLMWLLLIAFWPVSVIHVLHKTLQGEY